MQNLINRCLKILSLVVISGFLLLLTGCGASILKSPCANFGSHCGQAAINQWQH